MSMSNVNSDFLSIFNMPLGTYTLRVVDGFLLSVSRAAQLNDSSLAAPSTECTA